MKKKSSFCAAGCLLLAAGAAAGIGGQKILHPAADMTRGREGTGDLTAYKWAAVSEAECETAAAAEKDGTGQAEERGDSLTERQKRILRERHLPENYRELTALQKESIRTIEELLQYLETKYDRTFVFEEYHPPSVLEPDTVSMLFREEDTGTRSAVIRRTISGKEVLITDDFPAVAAESVLEEALKAFVSENLNTKGKVFAFVSRAELEMPPVDAVQLEGRVLADACIWLSDETVSKPEAEEFADKLSEWLSARKIRGRVQVMLLGKEDWERVNSRDYARFFADDVCLFRKVVRAA